MARFFVPVDIIVQQEVELDADQSQHLFSVLRLREHGEVEVFNGKGLLASALIVQATKRRVRVRVTAVQNPPTQAFVHLVFGTVKPAALEFILRKTMEVGVASFQPVWTQHSFHQKNWNPQRLQKLLIETAKQCEELFLPPLFPPMPLEQWLEQRSPKRTLVLCDEHLREGGVRLAPQGPVDFVVGSEGGWSEEERALFASHQALYLGLGSRKLRAETAALVGTFQLNQFFASNHIQGEL